MNPKSADGPSVPAGPRADGQANVAVPRRTGCRLQISYFRRRRLTAPRALFRSDRGAVAGVDGLIFGVLIFVIGMLVIVNLWSIVEARNVADATAREYLRAWTESSNPDEAAGASRSAAYATFEATGWRLSTWTLTPENPAAFGPCAAAAVSVTVRVPALRLPVVGGLGAHDVSVRRSAVVDAYRNVTAGPQYRRSDTACFG